ncbi:MAG TPA: glucose 1-dehydrogenase [bacterium]|nr:glucose 1-dehydrogenase [bacterium]
MDGLVAVVTGAGRGIGAAVTERFAAEGARVALWDVDRDAAGLVAGRLDPTGTRAIAVPADITGEAAVGRAVAETLERFGRLDVLVNNAGISRHRPIQDLTVEMFDEVMRVNVTGTFICCRAVVPVMTRQGRGKIVNISSLAARTGRPGVAVNYAAAKAAVIGLTQTLAREVGPAGIYVNAIAPGPILTDQTRQYAPEVFATWNAGRAVQRDGTPEDVADAAVYLASGRSDWVTGITLDVNGGILIR